jgi:hypothetical protein
MTIYSGLSLGHLLLLYQKSGQSEQCREGSLCGTKDQDASFLLENKNCSIEFHFYRTNIYASFVMQLGYLLEERHIVGLVCSRFPL